MDTELTKYCGKCGKIKSIAEFSKNRRTKDGLQTLCKSCSRENTKKYQSSIEYRKRNSIKKKENSSRYYKDHREDLLSYAQIYRLNHPETCRESARKRRSLKKKLPNNFTPEDENFALEYFNYRCAICGKELDLSKKSVGKSEWAMDHWIALNDPRPNNPGTVPTNMIPICNGKGSCNTSKRSNDPIEWLFKKFPEQAKEIEKRICVFFEVVSRHTTTGKVTR